MILTVTFNPAIDHTYMIDEDLAQENVARTSESQFDAGGKGINVSFYLKALGYETVATGLLGGFTGDFIRSELTERGLDHDFAETGTTRINTTVISEDSEYKINHSGPKAGEETVEALMEKIVEKEPEKIIVSGSLPPGLDHSAIERLEDETHAEVVADLHGDTLGELEGDYFIAKPNRDELQEATGEKVDTAEDAAEASEMLLQRGFRKVLASLGADGAVLSTPEQKLYASALDVDVQDTTGAGDAMLSATLAALEEDMSDSEALKKGLAFATLVVETPGTKIPDMEKLEEYMEKVEVEKI